jgi:probable F420-dependent oxidoreductase
LSVRIHVSCGFLPEEDVVELLPALERHGFDGATFPEHLFLPDSEPGRYPYSANGQPPFALDSPWPEPLMMAAAASQVTTRLLLTTAVQVLPLRHPVIVAKLAATAARLSRGRLVLGVGVGWQREEFEVLGVDFTRRGRLTDDAIEALRALWAPGSVRFESASYRFGPLLMEPKPPAIPILVGGAADGAIRRAVRLGDGYIMPTTPLAEVPRELERVRDALGQAGRDEAGFRVSVGCLGASAPEIVEMYDPLISDLVVIPWPHPGKTTTSVEEKLDHLARWSAEVMPAIRTEVARERDVAA